MYCTYYIVSVTGRVSMFYKCHAGYITIIRKRKFRIFFLRPYTTAQKKATPQRTKTIWA